MINLTYVDVLTRLLQFEGNVCRERTLQLLQNHMYELDYAVLRLLLHSLRKILKAGFEYLATVAHSTSCLK